MCRCPDSPSLERHRGHHAHEHDAEYGVVELHGAFDGEDQHAWQCLHCDACDRTWAQTQARKHNYNEWQYVNIFNDGCCQGAFWQYRKPEVQARMDRLTQQGDQKQNNDEVVCMMLFVEV